MAHLGIAAGYCIERLERRYQLAGGEDLDLELAPGHGRYTPGQTFGAGAQPGEILRPGGDQLEPLDPLGDRGRGEGGRCDGRSGGGAAGTGRLYEITTVHDPLQTRCSDATNKSAPRTKVTRAAGGSTAPGIRAAAR
jgi:hypothetical protein